MTNQTREFLVSTDAHLGRLLRRAYWVVWVETPVGDTFELDAEDRRHAARLAENWLRPELGAVSATVRRVLPSGKTQPVENYVPSKVVA